MLPIYFCLLIVPLYVLSIAGCAEKKEIPPPKSSSQPEVEQPGNIICDVILEGKAPNMNVVKMDADKKCVASHNQPVYFQTVMVNDEGKLQNAFIYIKSGLGSRTFPSPKEPVVLDQQGCMYEPHVIGLQVDQRLVILNSDPTLHNIHALPKINRGFNLAQPRRGMKTEKTFSLPEIMIRVKCDVHSWMSCYIGVLDHPFFGVTDSTGVCGLKDVPPGEYLITAWHEEYGTMEQKVTVKAGESATINFAFKGS
ncbi:MAG: hypothetical protein HY707_10635 [Ignavibacteriae bacterium]|nr:hypothetical protein [Ignavibacteriota bacterium]